MYIYNSVYAYIQYYSLGVKHLLKYFLYPQMIEVFPYWIKGIEGKIGRNELSGSGIRCNINFVMFAVLFVLFFNRPRSAPKF